MSNQNSYGQTSWSAKSGGDGEFGKGTEYLRLQNGSNLLRIVTAPYIVWKHSVETEGNSKSWGFNYGCVKKQASDHCPLCEMGNKAKKRFLFGVIDKKLGAYRILEVPSGVYNQITTYTNDPDWGGPEEGSSIFTFDMDLIKNPNPPSPSQTYSLVPKPKKPLSAAEIAEAEKADLEELDRRSSPPAIDRLQEKLANLRKEGTVIKTSTATLFGGDNSSSDSSTSQNDDGGFFTNYDMKTKVS